MGPTFLLKRIAMTDMDTFGVLLDNTGIPFILTLELPWKDNKHDESCIPAGTYSVKRTIKPVHGEVFEVQNVPNRADILIHKGNTVLDTKGCILIGENFGPVYGLPGIQASGFGYKELMDKLQGINEFTLKIVECL